MNELIGLRQVSQPDFGQSFSSYVGDAKCQKRCEIRGSR